MNLEGYNNNNEEDLLSKYILNVNYSEAIFKYHIQIWILIFIVIIAKILFGRYKENQKSKNKNKQPFSNDIIERNDENIRVSRLKTQEQYREDLKTSPIPNNSINEFDHNYQKRMGKPDSNKKNNNNSKKFTEGLNPSGSGARLSFNPGDRK
ncbi:hypothetical protein RB653_003828 [Dictyostelium firmibasis]|uniref:Uncharacterized protein n=1 Tax=Dictyostelium firmibasis TaxID=79012 RepID=A0AAN7Z2U8_9MYCE